MRYTSVYQATQAGSLSDRTHRYAHYSGFFLDSLHPSFPEPCTWSPALVLSLRALPTGHMLPRAFQPSSLSSSAAGFVRHQAPSKLTACTINFFSQMASLPNSYTKSLKSKGPPCFFPPHSAQYFAHSAHLFVDWYEWDSFGSVSKRKWNSSMGPFNFRFLFTYRWYGNSSKSIPSTGAIIPQAACTIGLVSSRPRAHRDVWEGKAMPFRNSQELPVKPTRDLN